MNYTYVLRCADRSLYTGWTNDLKKRVAAHNAGTGARYTRAHGPVELVYFEVSETKEEAMRRECRIKKLSKKQKEQLIAGFSVPAEYLSEKKKNCDRGEDSDGR